MQPYRTSIYVDKPRRFRPADLGESAAVGYPLRMLDRADSPATPGLPTASPAAFPGLGAAANPPESEAEAAFLAGAALARLDAIVRENPPWAGVFRRRLALTAAAASVRRAGRDRGRGGVARRVASHPAGRRSRARGTAPHRLAGTCRSLGRAVASVFRTPPPRSWGSRTTRPARGDRRRRGVRRRRPAGAVRRGAGFRPRAARADAKRRAPVAWGPGRGGRAARGLARRRRAGAAAEMAVRACPCSPRLCLRAADGARAGDVADGAEGAIVFAYAKAAARPVDLSAELGRRAQRLQDAAPKLRAKGAGAALQALLDEDFLSAATKLAGSRSAGRDGCSTGWSRSARSAN